MDRPLTIRPLAGHLMVWPLTSRLMLPRTKPRYPSPSRMRPAAKRLRPSGGSGLAAPRSVLWAKRFACAIRTTGSSCCGNPALCAAAFRRIRITSRLHNRVHSDAE
jgi:hypothetical protein